MAKQDEVYKKGKETKVSASKKLGSDSIVYINIAQFEKGEKPTEWITEFNRN